MLESYIAHKATHISRLLEFCSASGFFLYPQLNIHLAVVVKWSPYVTRTYLFYEQWQQQHTLLKQSFVLVISMKTKVFGNPDEKFKPVSVIDVQALNGYNS